MGLSKSKPREKKVEEQKKNSTSFVTKSKEKVMEKESRHSEKEALSHPADSLLFTSGTSKHSRPSSSFEGRRPEETCHVKASGMGPISKALMMQEVNMQDSWCRTVNKSTTKLDRLSP